MVTRSGVNKLEEDADDPVVVTKEPLGLFVNVGLEGLSEVQMDPRDDD